MTEAKRGYVYIITNKKNGTLYIGITSSLVKRIYEHKHKLVDGFTKKYDLTLLVYYEIYDSIVDAIEREKKIKKYKRQYKINLINEMNPEWNDLYNTVI